MDDLKAQLLDELRNIDGVEDRSSPVAGGTALFYRGKPFAHFHNDRELDLRLTKKVIRSEKLTHPSGSVHHLDRSANSPWIEIRFNDEKEMLALARLVRLAVAQL